LSRWLLLQLVQLQSLPIWVLFIYGSVELHELCRGLLFYDFWYIYILHFNLRSRQLFEFRIILLYIVSGGILFDFSCSIKLHELCCGHFSGFDGFNQLHELFFWLLFIFSGADERLY